MPNPERLLVIAGELSGDRYAAALVSELRNAGPVEIMAIGGPLLHGMADRFLGDCTGFTSVGVRSMTNMRSIFKVFDVMETAVAESPVRQAIIVDFPHYNFEIARRLKKNKIPITTVITPNFWIWNDRRAAKKIAHYSDKIVTIFPGEYKLYQSIGATTAYFGNPLVDLMPPLPAGVQRPHLNDGTDRPIRVGLFPGSRASELKLLLRPTIEAAAVLAERSPRFEFVIPMARDEFRSWVDQELTRCQLSSVTVAPPLTAEQMAALDFAICATGTMTLELVLNRVPMIVLGALSPLSYWLATRVLRIKIPFCGLPNLVAGRQVVPEFMQSGIQPIPIADAVCHHLRPESQELQQTHYSELINILRGESTSSVVSQIVSWITPSNGPQSIGV